MAKRKRSGRPPQAQHNGKSQPSQHDKRQRLATRSPQRQSTRQTNVPLTGEAILKIVSDRWSIEEHFHDVKEIWGAGEQQVRNVWSSIGCWHVCGWFERSARRP